MYLYPLLIVTKEQDFDLSGSEDGIIHHPGDIEGLEVLGTVTYSTYSLGLQYIGEAFVILELARNSRTPPTAFSSDIKDVSPIPMMMRSSLEAILENLILDFLSLTFFKTLEMFLRSEIFAELFCLDIAKAV